MRSKKKVAVLCSERALRGGLFNVRDCALGSNSTVYDKTRQGNIIYLGMCTNEKLATTSIGKRGTKVNLISKQEERSSPSLSLSLSLY